MKPAPSFIRFASVCCFLSVITTLGIHLWFPEPPTDFEQRIHLFKNTVYIFNRWWVIIHCLLVLIAMWGVALIMLRNSSGFIPLGFLFFAVFAMAEITRQMYVLMYMNGLRQQYFVAADNAVKEVLKNALSTAGLQSAPLFGVFILAFGLGNLFYGLAMFKKSGFTRLLSILFIFWATANFLALGNEFWDLSFIDTFLGKYSFTYQPIMRILIALWLWKKATLIRDKMQTTGIVG